jgi:hypothetical protein
LSVIVLSLFALLLTVAVKCYASIVTIKAVALFLGLEGTALLASALSPPHDEIKEDQPRGFLKHFFWWFTEGRNLAWPIRYNPVFFYGGLAFLALSMVLSTISV